MTFPRATRWALGSLAVLLPFAIGAALQPRQATAADHIDGPSAQIDPASDIQDLFAWMSPDATRLNLVLDAFYSAGRGAAFSPAVQYAFHIESGAAYGAVSDEVVVLCQFYDVNRVECWGAGEYVAGDPSDPAGIVSESGRMRVFAGLRDDPFFMEYLGFNAVVDQVVAAAPSLTFDSEGCPDVPPEVQAALVGQLQAGPNGEPASDTQDRMNVLSLVVQLDPTLVTTNGQLLAVWASTHASPAGDL